MASHGQSLALYSAYYGEYTEPGDFGLPANDAPPDFRDRRQSRAFPSGKNAKTSPGKGNNRKGTGNHRHGQGANAGRNRRAA